MITNSEKIELIKKLNTLHSPEEVLNYIIENYDLKSARLGVTTKPLFIDGTIKALNLVGAKRKIKA